MASTHVMDENVPLAAASKKGAGKAKQPAKASAPLQSSNAYNAGAGKTIEEIYQKKTQLEHILLRPDTYVGSVEKLESTQWVYESEKMVCRKINYVPGLYKIFDEILVNAADNKQRDSTMDTLKVDIDAGSNTIRVWNNGAGIPVEIHAEEKVYVPELIFGHLLTSSNYDDKQKKTTGGRNGYGAKLTNIFSTEFTVETADAKRGKTYKQTFRDNMSVKGEPVIGKCGSALKDQWTSVTFKPDLSKFNMDHLEVDVVSLMSKRVVDIAGCLGKAVKVFLNGTRLQIASFTDYASLYLSSAQKEDTAALPMLYEKVNDRWEVVVSTSDGQFQQVSFVNSIATTRGGTHVTFVTDQIVNSLLQKILKKKEAQGTKAFQVRNHLWVFVNALIENPAFDSQTKETLTTRATSFGSKCDLSENFLGKVLKCGVMESILSFARFKNDKDLKKTDGSKRSRLTGIAKLDDANDAGGRNSEQCTLILTEGDSAKSLAVSGLSVVGRDKYGVFPLRGKLLNVRDASTKQIMDNAEITYIKQIMGLQQGKEYDSVKSLRYGHLMIMTDQDHDGSHIKGLLINMLHASWPSLLKIPNFLLEFITPIVKAKHNVNKQVHTFYTMPEYEEWKDSLGDDTKHWEIKYYKGLGTSTNEEGKEYFSALDRHRKSFTWKGDEDGEAIEMAFSKKKVEQRKVWLSNYEPGSFLDQKATEIPYSDFVNKELILFSLADLARSIPSLMDGLKPGQRKVLYTCFKLKQNKDMKVAALAGTIVAQAAYHHGDAALTGTIIGLAQDFVGSNNVNLLVPSGQFGTRAQGGKDAASPRYVHTKLSPITRSIFPEADDCLLNYINDDGQWVEPTWYAPILPAILLNGGEGIGTGWSTSIPNYNPRDVVENLRRLLRDEPMVPMDPWYKGFQGCISRGDKPGTFSVEGIIRKVDAVTLEICELPIRKWTLDYKEFLESLMVASEKNKEPFVRDYREFHECDTVHFEVTLVSEEAMAAAEAEGLIKRFKLTGSINTTNMHLFDADGHIRKYDNPEQILQSFFTVRRGLYAARKASLIDQIKQDLAKASARVRFILAVVRGELIVNNRKKAELLAELERMNYPPLAKKRRSGNPNTRAGEEDDAEDPDAPTGKEANYDYLLSMPIWSLTLERVNSLLKEEAQKKADMEVLMGTAPEEMWERDLEVFLKALEAREKEEAAQSAKDAANRKAAGGGRGGKGAKRNPTAASKKARSKGSDNEDSDDEYAPQARKAAPAAPKPKLVIGAGLNTGLSQSKATLVDLCDDSGPSVTAAAARPRATGTGAPKAQRAKKATKDKAVSDETEEEASGISETSAATGNGGAGDESGSAASGPVTKEAPVPKKASGASGAAGAGGKKRGPAAKAAKPAAAAAPKSKPLAAASAAEVVLLDGSPSPAPDKKVRRIRPSPFNKKSGAGSAEGVALGGKSSPVPTIPEFGERRPVRAARKPVAYYNLDSDEDEDKASDGDDDDFSES